MFLPLNKTLIIAEAGINHDGDFKRKKHVDAAVAAGADFVKFQSFVAEELVHRKPIDRPISSKGATKAKASAICSSSSN